MNPFDLENLEIEAANNLRELINFILKDIEEVDPKLIEEDIDTLITTSYEHEGTFNTLNRLGHKESCSIINVDNEEYYFDESGKPALREWIGARDSTELNIERVGNLTGLSTEDVERYIEYDFGGEHVDEDGDPLTTDTLVSHIQWQEQLQSAMRDSEATGQPFDHIMGEILGGVR